MYVAIDTETESLAARYDASVPIWCASFAWRDGNELLSTALPWDEAKQELELLLADEAVIFLIHNAAFDIPVLRLRGIDIPPGRYLDTMLMSYVWYPGGDHALKDWGIKLGHHKGEFKDFSKLSQEMLEYSEQDARICHYVFDELKPQLESDEQALELFLDIEMPFVEVIIEMEQTGLYIDKHRLPEVRRDLCKRAETELKKIRELVPFVPGKEKIYKNGAYKQNGIVRYNHCELKPFNPNSHDQLASLLIKQGWKPTEFTPAGKPQTGAAILEELDGEKYPIIEPLLEYTGIQKIENTFLSSFAELSDEKSILRGSFNQAVTLTGRLSSSDPNLQNIPRRGDLGQVCRSLITTPNPEVVSLISGDLSNIEGRVLAYYLYEILDDDRLVKVFQDGIDFHQANADIIGVVRELAKTLLYACVPFDTEALTQKGWKHYNELQEGELVLTYDIQLDKYVWSPILEKVKYDSAPIVELRNSHTSFRSTPNHRWYGDKRYSPKKAERYIQRQVFTTDEMNSEYRIYMSTSGSIDDKYIPEDETDIVQWVLSLSRSERQAFIRGIDESSTYTQNSTYVVHQSIPEKLQEAWSLAKLLEGYAIRSTTERNDYPTWSASPRNVFTGQRLEKINHPNEPVWCIRTETGSWVMKQNNQVTITGNTMYGAGINKLAKTMKVSTKEAKRVYNLLVEKFPSLFELRDAAIDETKQAGGILYTLMGRRLVYPYIMSRKSDVRARSERQIFNALLQGTAADIMKRLTIDTFDLIYDYGGKIAASVHDELLIYCLTETAHELATELTRIWSSSQYLAPVPILAKFKVGTNWRDLH